MAVSRTLPGLERSSLSTALIITRRELRDSIRDWRILTPTIILTLIFPFIMTFTSAFATNWVQQFAASLVVERINPFLLMIVGFFPISFSLVIALESFVGEKERNSLEPLLSMPVSDLELYVGKMLAALLLPVSASYLGISVFLVSRYFASPSWIPTPGLLVLMVLLTTVKALVMVSGAVVISSQTTSVRAANLLASFIIIPMALLIQVESVIMFNARYGVLWWFIIGLLVVDLILVRMGIRIFNREEIISKEMDEIKLKTLWRDFWGYFLRPPALQAQRHLVAEAKFDLVRIYRSDLPHLLARQRLPLLVVVLVVAGAMVGGAVAAPYFPFPSGSLQLDQLQADAFRNLDRVGLFGNLSPWWILGNNVRAIVLAMVLGLFSFGSLALILLMIPMGLVGFFAGEIFLLGQNPWLFLATFILPHGLFELPAAILGTAFALRIGAALVSPPAGLDVGQGVLLAVADFVKVFVFIVIPLLFIAAFIEGLITPQIVLAVYRRG
jgi:ABC-type transport system involved in multi-copper enzyme maturation permease subunit